MSGLPAAALRVLAIVVAALYTALVVMLSVYGFYCLIVAVYFWAVGGRRQGRSLPLAPPSGEWPSVTVQLPIYNEHDLLERVLSAVAAFDYPVEKLQIQILDDSTDDTVERARQLAQQYRQKGFDVTHLHRTDRSGFKAGALAAAMPHVRGEFVAVFDVDFIPPPDFLKRILPCFTEDRIACVQARWGHLNADYSPLTQFQSLVLDTHFLIEQAAWEQAGLFMMFNGSGGIWRTRAIEESGGWQGDTLTEDLDLAYRAQMRGWRFALLPEVVVPGELPAQLDAWRRQQFRWAKGNLQATVKLTGMLMRAPLPFAVKLSAFLHMSKHLSQPLALGVLLLTPLLPLLHISTAAALSLCALAAVGAPLMCIMAQFRQPDARFGRLWALPLLYVLNAGLVLSATLACLEVLRGIPSVFERTPKFGLRGARESWQHSRYALSRSRLVWGELLLGLYALVSLALTWWSGSLAFVPWLLVYVVGFGLVAGISLWQDWQRQERGRLLPQPVDAVQSLDGQ